MNLKKLFITSIFTLYIVMFISCEKDTQEVEKSTENIITSFIFDGLDEDGSAVIDNLANTVSLYLDENKSLRALKPIIEVSKNATITPESGVVKDFSGKQKVQYLVEAESGRIRSYFVQVFPYSTRITDFDLEGAEIIEKTILDNSVNIKIKKGESSVYTPVISVPEGCAVSPESGVAQDFSNPVEYIVNSPVNNGLSRSYTVTVEEVDSDSNTGIRAVWVPTPNHTSSMANYDNIVNFVNTLDELNINAVYVCAWAQQKTTFPSQVLVDNSSYTSKSQGYWFNNYIGGSGDPLADLIDLAHSKNIKVIMWFEYGFMARWGSAPSVENDPLLAVHPEWASKNSKGEFSNYNGTDYYYNAFHSGIQEFIIQLMEELMDNYNIDGIQGDDRLPAMPSDSGYDDYTVELYKKDHAGQTPPSSPRDNNWYQWRIDILNNFAHQMYTRIKAKNPDCIVASAPNVYPWSYDNLMQDWPTWIANGDIELISPQCYRYSLDDYRWTMKNAQNYANANSDRNIFNPGVLLATGSYTIEPEFLKNTIITNRENGTLGEAYFFDAALKIPAIQEVIKEMYISKVEFPNLTNK